MGGGVASLYEGWPRINAALMHRLPRLGPDELQLRGAADAWPIWALISHLAGTRVYWLCGVFQQPGAETTPFADPFGELWEDQPDLPRSSEELLRAVDSSWRIVESCLEGWTVESLAESVIRPGTDQVHTRRSVLTRLVMHDAFHCGEASLLLGIHGRASLDPWEPVA